MRILFAVVILIPSLTWAQMEPPVRGRIVDEGGGPLSGAHVRLVPTRENATWSRPRYEVATVSRRDGSYVLPEVSNGHYSIEVQLEGFMNVIYAPLVVSYGSSINLNVELKLGHVQHDYVEPAEGWPILVAGELDLADGSFSNYEVCLSGRMLDECVDVNTLGQYAIEVPLGEYRVTVKSPQGVLFDEVLSGHDLALADPLRGPIRFSEKIRLDEGRTGTARGRP